MEGARPAEGTRVSEKFSEIKAGGGSAPGIRGVTPKTYPPGGDTLNGGHFRLRSPLLQIFLCLIREKLCPCFQSKAKTAPVVTIRRKTGSKTCHYRSLWMADLRPRQAPVNGGL